jgi:serine/threonine protein kinase
VGGKPIELRDLSVGGAQVSGPEAPETGDEGDVTFVNVEDGAYVHVPSRAVWSRHTASEDRAGLSFEPDGGAQARVARAVSAFVFAAQRVSPSPASSHFRVGSFEVLEPLAQGNTYEVYRGRGISGPFQGREVALKRLDPHRAARPERVERFLAEADLGRILPSQFIAPVLTAFAVGDERWMAAEWVEGTTLAAMLEEWSAAGRLPPVRGVLDIFAQVLAGLAEAHEFRGGVSHGHLDASQILLAPGGQVKLIGFLGDPRRALASDVFQAAALLYRTLGGRPPFEANSAEHYAALVGAGPRPLRMLNADVPQSVEALVHSALRSEPARRPASASAFARALAVARQEN